MVVDARNSVTMWHIHGAWRLHGGEPTVAVIEGSRRVPPLLCVLALRQPDDEDLAAQVLDAIADAYADPAPATLTTRITQAVQAAHGVLLAANADLAASERHGAALACLVQRGDQVYVAHAGPVACHVLASSGADDGPAEPPTPMPLTLPLGRRGAAAVSLASLRIGPLTRLALAAGPLVPRLDDEAWAWLLETPEPRALRARLEQLQRMGEVPDLVLAIVAPSDDAATGDDHPRWRRRGPASRRALARTTVRTRQPAPATEQPATPWTLPANHHYPILAGVLFALVFALVAGGILLRRAPSAMPTLAGWAPVEGAQASAPPATERSGEMRMLASRGAAFASDTDGAPTSRRPEPAGHRADTIALGALRPIAHVPGGGLSDLALLDRTLVVVESGAGRVTKYLLDPLGVAAQPEVLWQAGEQRGAIRLGRPLRAAVVDRGRAAASDLVVLTEDGALWLLGEAGVRPLPSLPQPMEIGRVAAAQGTIYALTTTPGAVWTLALGQPAEGWKRMIEADGARDLAVDGAVYLLRPEGQITRHAAAATLPFRAVIPAEPLRAPRAIATHPQARHVYVLEPTRQRVVVLAKDGSFVQQLRFTTGATSGELRLLAQDEHRGWLVTADGERVYVAPLPR